MVGQRFVPGISDALASYTFGAFGVPLWQMVVGSFIGSAPRVFVYTALGASITNLSSPLVYSAIAVWCVTAIIGASPRGVGTGSGVRARAGGAAWLSSRPVVSNATRVTGHRRASSCPVHCPSTAVSVKKRRIASSITRPSSSSGSL